MLQKDSCILDQPKLPRKTRPSTTLKKVSRVFAKTSEWLNQQKEFLETAQQLIEIHKSKVAIQMGKNKDKRSSSTQGSSWTKYSSDQIWFL